MSIGNISETETPILSLPMTSAQETPDTEGVKLFQAQSVTPERLVTLQQQLDQAIENLVHAYAALTSRESEINSTRWQIDILRIDLQYQKSPLNLLLPDVESFRAAAATGRLLEQAEADLPRLIQALETDRPRLQQQIDHAKTRVHDLQQELVQFIQEYDLD